MQFRMGTYLHSEIDKGFFVKYEFCNEENIPFV